MAVCRRVGRATNRLCNTLGRAIHWVGRAILLSHQNKLLLGLGPCHSSKAPQAVTRLYSNRDRPFDWGVLPTELLTRDVDARIQQAAQPTERHSPTSTAIRSVLPEYRALYERFFDGQVAVARAPVPDDLALRSANLKASAFFLDATLAGICRIEPGDWRPDSGLPRAHKFALVFLIEFGREPAPGEPGAQWILGSNADWTDLRCAELAVVLAGYIRALGWSATGQVDEGAVNIEVLAQRAGLVLARDGILRAPMIERGFRLGVVTTDFPMAVDWPLSEANELGWPNEDAWQGRMGTRPGWTESRLAGRPLHMGRYPMETIKRVDEPTTLILRDEIKRVPKRAEFFNRALAGDLGERARKERSRFAVKHPLAWAMTPLIRNLVPLQGVREPLASDMQLPAAFTDAQANTEAIKALGYFLGADLVGVCEAEPWMYYSHDETEGRPIDTYHRYAVVMLIDQGFETMEGASGDDWISGAQSMRAYLRGALIAGVMAALLREQGFSARSHSNAHSEILQIPAVLMAGLGELSRIGELVLNPFIGPRSKSVLFSTSLPLVADKPIDFDLQAFCNQCNKCARECPCNAIPYGPKVMFNGYEIWKPDVEKCAKYRLTNMKGSACGRCMKMCPWNREDTAEWEQTMRTAINEPEARAAIIANDDSAGGGLRNTVKRWWFDLEIVDGVAIKPAAGSNERDLTLGRAEKLATEQKLAFFPPGLAPRGGATISEVIPVDRQAGLQAYAQAESPESARVRSGKRLRAADHSSND